MIKSTCRDSDYIFEEYNPFCKEEYNCAMSVCLPPDQAYNFTISDLEWLCCYSGKRA